MSYQATLIHGENYVLMGAGLFRRGEPRGVSAAVRLQLEEQARATGDQGEAAEQVEPGRVANDDQPRRRPLVLCAVARR